jgi:CRP-like cAMP-binding protein
MGLRSRLWGRVEDEVRPEIEKRIEAGTVLFRAGDPCHAVAWIRDGEVELLREENGEMRRIGVRGRGAVIGDDAVLTDGIVRHTVRSLGGVTVEMLARDVFLERFGEPEPEPVVEEQRSLVYLLPASPASAAALPEDGIEISEFPFIIGRTSSQPSESLSRRMALLLDDRQPYHLSRRQFAIVRTELGMALTDQGSRLGTFVDGVRLGPEPLPLARGHPVAICAGGLHSPFRFQLWAA